MTTLNDYSPAFRHVRIELAREKDHPEGSRHAGYDLILPLHEDGRIDEKEWTVKRDVCRVRRFEDDLTDAVGTLAKTEDGQWSFHYDPSVDEDDIGFQFDTEHFVPGEYVSVTHHGHNHTYRVAFVRELA